MLSKRNRLKLLIILSFLLFLFFIVKGINQPFVGPNATNFTVYSLIAHNFNKYGYIETKFAPVIAVAPKLPEKPDYFFHHPTFLSFSESLLFRLFGESFWVGRLTVILYALGSFLLTYFIGKLLINKTFGALALTTAAFIPASTIFGKLIGQEPLVLFFCLALLYSSLKYFKTDNKFYLLLGCVTIVLGLLSDWPMLLFVPALFPLFYIFKKLRVWILMLAILLSTFGLLLLYIYIMQSGFWDLYNALNQRGVTGLLTIPYWPIVWLATTVFRLLLYYNPILFILSLVSFIVVIKQYTIQKTHAFEVVLLCLFLFASAHIVVYTEAAFTHPYLNYYWLPFITFGAAYAIKYLLESKRYTVLGVLAVFSFIYLLVLTSYKDVQVTSNLWRYDVTKKIASYLQPYEEIYHNGDNAINNDLLWYPFLIRSKQTPKNVIPADIAAYSHYVYTCEIKCNPGDIDLVHYQKTYAYIQILHPQAEVFVFFLKDRHPKKDVVMMSDPYTSTNNEHIQYVRNVYRWLREILKIPQV